MEISKGLVQYLKTDATGKFGEVVSVNGGVVTVDLDQGVSARLQGKAKGVGPGDKVYFDDEGKESKIVEGPKKERPKGSQTPRQGCAYVKHPY